MLIPTSSIVFLLVLGTLLFPFISKDNHVFLSIFLSVTVFFQGGIEKNAQRKEEIQLSTQYSQKNKQTNKKNRKNHTGMALGCRDANNSARGGKTPAKRDLRASSRGKTVNSCNDWRREEASRDARDVFATRRSDEAKCEARLRRDARRCKRRDETEARYEVMLRQCRGEMLRQVARRGEAEARSEAEASGEARSEAEPRCEASLRL